MHQSERVRSPDGTRAIVLSEIDEVGRLRRQQCIDAGTLLGSVERGEWKSAGGGKCERARFRYAKARPASPDRDVEPAAQVRTRAAQRGVTGRRLTRRRAFGGVRHSSSALGLH